MEKTEQENKRNLNNNKKLPNICNNTVILMYKHSHSKYLPFLNLRYCCPNENK